MMRHLTLLTFILLILSLPVMGQDEEYVDYEDEEEVSRVHFIEGNFSIFSPVAEFKETIEKGTMYGFSFGFLMQIQKEKPAFIGIEAFHMSLGSYSKEYEAIVGNEQLILDGRVASHALGLSLNYRYYIPYKLWRIEPYLEGQLGLKWMYSYLSETGAFIDDEPYDNFDILTGEWVMAYGGTFGFQMHISDIYYLNFKSTYHSAVSGEYQKKIEGNLGTVEFPQDAFETVQSATNMVKIDVGMTFLF